MFFGYPLTMRLENLLKLATLAAQIQRGNAGFRQKDVRFLYEQLWNWQSFARGSVQPARLHNTQIQRFLTGMVSVNLLRARTRGPHPSYVLDPSGCFHLTRELRDTALAGSLQEFRLITYFFSAYGERLSAYAKSPEVRVFTAEAGLARKRKAIVEEEIVYWKERVRVIREVVKQTKARLARNEAPESIVNYISKTYPYELNYQKTLMEIFDETERPLMVWELVEGNLLRIRRLWEPRIRELEAEWVALSEW